MMYQFKWQENRLQGLKATWQKHELKFKNPSGTSRGVLLSKNSYFIRVMNKELVLSISEVSVIEGLSRDDIGLLEDKIEELCQNISDWKYYLNDGLKAFPSIKFALEMSLLELQEGGKKKYFKNSFYESNEGIPINGLIWMGDYKEMSERIHEKIEDGFRCIKMKIGAIDFEQELDLLKKIRRNFNSKDLELRVDANGAFSVGNALEKLKRLSEYEIHSIEQPIKAGQWEEMACLCTETPLDIALDEELIGDFDYLVKKKMLEVISPQYVILKPSLLGGFQESQEWIELAEASEIGWWMTSALESNIGLNAIAQYTSYLETPMYQGLGTGSLYLNNIDSPLEVKEAKLYYNPHKQWKEDEYIRI